MGVVVMVVGESMSVGGGGVAVILVSVGVELAIWRLAFAGMHVCMYLYVRLSMHVRHRRGPARAPAPPPSRCGPAAGWRRARRTWAAPPCTRVPSWRCLGDVGGGWWDSISRQPGGVEGSIGIVLIGQPTHRSIDRSIDGMARLRQSTNTPPRRRPKTLFYLLLSSPGT